MGTLTKIHLQHIFTEHWKSIQKSNSPASTPLIIHIGIPFLIATFSIVLTNFSFVDKRILWFYLVPCILIGIILLVQFVYILLSMAKNTTNLPITNPTKSYLRLQTIRTLFANVYFNIIIGISIILISLLGLIDIPLESNIFRPLTAFLSLGLIAEFGITFVLILMRLFSVSKKEFDNIEDKINDTNPLT